MSDREQWLNGWPRSGLYGVMMGSAIHCVGCGKFHGVTTIAITEDHEWPTNDPAWPFDDEHCPVHKNYELLRNLSTDMHMASNRPCKTCRQFTEKLGWPFGCYERQAKTNA